MKTTVLSVLALVLAGCSQQETPSPSREAVNPSENTAPESAEDVSTAGPEESAAVSPAEETVDSGNAVSDSETVESSAADPDKAKSPTIKPLTAQQQKKLLDARLNGGMDYSFGQFANMFLVTSRLHFGTGIGLMTSEPEISELPLLSPFPPSYKPTLREFLDSIALQTFSKWEYDPSSKYFQSDIELEGPVDGIAIFEFKKTERVKPYVITLAEGWEANDQGSWVMHVPPDFPVGMDIYEMGTYSPEKEAAGEAFAETIRAAVSLQWAQRVNEEAKPEEMKSAKVGKYDALYYESMIPSQLGKDIKWRQWVFMVDHQCYFIVSTILPEFEEKIFPDVQKMLASFQIRSE